MSRPGSARLAQENVVAVVLLLVFGGIVWLCQDFGPRARMIPLPLALFGIALTIIQILWQNLRSTDELQMELLPAAMTAVEPAAAPAAAAQPEAAAPAEGAPAWRGELKAVAIVGALIALIMLTGIIPAVFLFTGGYFVLTRHYSWLMGIAYTSVFTASVYVMFVFALQIQPYHGLLAPLVDRFQ
jgi:hypothetical protein